MEKEASKSDQPRGIQPYSDNGDIRVAMATALLRSYCSL